ncbi:HET-domain-containing protein, partial [Polyplosphaeria fusca]
MSICKEWLTCCRENHRACDHVGNLPKNLRVIDCHLLEIIAAPPKAAYIALSYVWGSVRPNHASEFTRTVRDAIAVAKSLGYRYLWVDKHCIDQENDDDKHDQIHQMDLVYQAADLTIIAAAGSNADAGLPGVLDTPRNQQPVVEVGDVEIINSMPHPHNTILRSRWSTRAWTLQEAVLSRRRLVFTQDQTYFECGLMNCCE